MCGREPPKLRLPRHLMYPFALAAQAMAHKSRTFLDSRWIADVKASHVL
jgi:hypothetical protein